MKRMSEAVAIEQQLRETVTEEFDPIALINRFGLETGPVLQTRWAKAPLLNPGPERIWA